MREIDENISHQLETVARQEFLSLGYNQASLRNIVNKCGVSTQTIYLRYGSKEGLFDYLVQDTAQAFLSLFRDLHQLSLTDQASVNHSLEATDQVLDFIYDHFEDFKLIFCKSKGSQYENYFKKLIEIEEESIMNHLQTLKYPNLPEMAFFVHKKATEGMNDLFEIVYHDLNREEAHKYMDLVKKFRMAGWKAVLA